MGDFVREPHRDQLGVEPKSARRRVRDAREMFNAYERDAAAVDHHLSRVRGADADHEDDVDVAVDLEQQSTLLFRRARERDDIGAAEHRAQILAIGAHRVTNDFLEVRTGGLDDVVVPVRLEQRTMRFEVPVVCGGRVRALQYREKIGQQVDQHEAEAISCALGVRRRDCVGATQPRGMYRRS